MKLLLIYWAQYIPNIIISPYNSQKNNDVVYFLLHFQQNLASLLKSDFIQSWTLVSMHLCFVMPEKKFWYIFCISRTSQFELVVFQVCSNYMAPILYNTVLDFYTRFLNWHIPEWEWERGLCSSKTTAISFGIASGATISKTIEDNRGGQKTQVS